MNPVLRILGVVFVFFVAAAAWLALGGVNAARTSEQEGALAGRVADLWGSSQRQAAPTFTLEWDELVTETRDIVDARGQVVDTRLVSHMERRSRVVDPASTDVDVDLDLDLRRKGLVWFPLYDVRFDGAWTYTHTEAVPRDLRLVFAFPDQQSLYDDFRFAVDGQDLGQAVRPVEGRVDTVVTVQPGQTVSLGVGYRSRGADEWAYQPSAQVGQVEDFRLTMTTDFSDIDFPAYTLSPSARTPTDDGWTLDWTFARVVTGYGVGMAMPTVVQPGELASQLSFTAPLSLGLFFLWIYVLGLLRGQEIHPINYLFIAAAFFAFNLLFSYTADLVPVEAAFALASVVSVGLVASYLRLVVGGRFALVEAGLAQLLYQVGFGVAHFYDGLTGLTITVLGIVTLFALMQLTGRVEWSRALSRPRTA